MLKIDGSAGAFEISLAIINIIFDKRLFMSTKQKINESIVISTIFIIVYLLMTTFFPSDTLGWPALAFLLVVYNLGLWIFY